MILSEHLVKCDTDDKPFDTYWYKYTIGRLQQVFLAVSIIINLYFIKNINVDSIKFTSFFFNLIQTNLKLKIN